MSSPPGQQPDTNYVTELQTPDVLFGRGSGPNDHEGNIRFRDMVASRKTEYMATNHRMTKAKIAREIVDKVFADGGRFLKKMEPSEAQKLGIPESIDAYVVADEDTIMEKAKQALRQNTSKAKDKSPARDRGNSRSPVRSRSPMPGGSGGRAGYPAAADAYADLEPIPIAAVSSSRVPTPPASNPMAGLRPLPPQHYRDTSGAQMPPPTRTTMGGNHNVNNNYNSLPPQQLQQQQATSYAQQQAYGGQQNVGGRQQEQQQQQQQQQQAYLQQQQQHQMPDRNETMLAHVPVGMLQNTARAGGGGRAGMSPDIAGSMMSVGTFGLSEEEQNLRGSVAMANDNHRGSIQITDLMDSFSKMRASGQQLKSDVTGDETRKLQDEKGGQQRSPNKQFKDKMFASTETMGTIDMGFGSVADMSVNTLNSSTFSFVKNESGDSQESDSKQQQQPSLMGRQIYTTQQQASPSGNPNPYSGTFTARSNTATASPSRAAAGGGGNIPEELPPKRGLISEPSITIDQAWAKNSGRKSSGGGFAPTHSLVGGPLTGSGVAFQDGGREKGAAALADNPRPIGLMEDEPDSINLDGMGVSDMSLLKGAFTSTEQLDDSLLDNINPQTAFSSNNNITPRGSSG